jgi:enamine deaminase RidA (YjgF/YER057c/UK114 family)
MTRRALSPSAVFDSTRFGFSQAVVTHGPPTIHVSGQVGWDPVTGAVGPDLAAQIEEAFRNLARVLDAADADLSAVAALRIYIVESTADDLAPVRVALQRHFPSDPPAATWLIVSRLADNAMLGEVEAIAVR